MYYQMLLSGLCLITIYIYRVSKLHWFSNAYRIHNRKISFMDGDWLLPVLGCGNISCASDWVFSPCLENLFTCDSNRCDSCSCFLLVSLYKISEFKKSKCPAVINTWL